MTLIEQTRERAQKLATQAVTAARATGRRSADGLERVNGPVQKLTEAGLALNQISASYISRLLKQQADIVEGMLSEGARRLRAAAAADSLRGMWREQLSLVPASRERLIADARGTFAIVRETGQELRGLVRGTANKLRGSKADDAGTEAKPARRAKKSADAGKDATH